MTPAARVQAAIQCLDQYLAGSPVEKSLTNWARNSRFAGSKDRAAVRDLVFRALRCRRSFAWMGGADTGRGLMLGTALADGLDPNLWFCGEGYAPEVLTEAERGATRPIDQAPEPVQVDLPDWIYDLLSRDDTQNVSDIARQLQQRAPVFLRVNLRKADITSAQMSLAAEDIDTAPHPLASTALEVLTNPRKIRQSRAYLDGLVEIQDAASQAVIEAAPKAGRILDYCAGGGGKALALAARGAEVFAHDISFDRMRDVPMRAKRAGVSIPLVDQKEIQRLAPFDMVFCDVPCSGSGSWRRSPEEKWRLTPGRLQKLTEIQRDILNKSSNLVAPGGALVYATCSILDVENDQQVNAFCNNENWTCESMRKLRLSEGGDGFFIAILRANQRL